MPSGILCSVTASTNIVVREKPLLGPSGVSAPWCRWGTSTSSRSRNPTPSQNPITAGRNASRPSAADCSMAGESRLQMDAATMTPAANPVSARCTPGCRDFFIKNTQADPMVVPAKGMRIPINALVSIY